MTAALILKELRQHWLAFLLIGLLSGFGLLVLTAGVAIQGLSGSMFEALLLFLRSFFLVATLVLCNRLVVCEYQSKTQLFLQGLPISRLHMVTVKYLFGLLLIMTMVTIAFLSLLLVSAPQEELTTRFVQLLAARTYAFAWCAYSCFFMMGLLGRYRVAIYLFAIMGCMAVDTLTKLELSRFGPFALLDNQFGYERFDWPTESLMVTVGITIGLVTVTGILALVREGSVASLLAEKMSHREKVFLAVLLLGFVFAVSIFDERAKKQPFDLPNSIVAEVGDVTVKVSVGASSDTDRGLRLAEMVAGEVAALQEYLRVDEFPPIFIVQRRDLDAERYERAVLDGAEGLLVRANFLSDDWQDGRFLSWILRELIISASDGRVKLEPNMWVLDGFALYWNCQDAESKRMDYATLDLRAAYGKERGFAVNDAKNWLTYRERVGEEIAAAVAWSGLISLKQSQGEPACRSFLQAMLDCNVPGDVRGVWHEWQNPLPQVMEREAGLPLADFMATWSEGLETRRRERAEDLTRIPKLEGTIRFEAMSASTRIVSFEFSCDPPPEKRFTLIHIKLPPFDDELPTRQLHREEFQYASQRNGELPGSYARGTRFGSTFAVWDEQLGCEIISGWTRQEMR
jgi:hypothetical protein